MKQVYENILECVGSTPIVKLNHLGSDLPHTFYVKLELLNPGNSVKDRIAIQMIDDAMEAGKLKPEGTVIECTSGNTGMGLAMIAAVRGLKCICVMPDKVSEEKIKALRAFGARVITTPTAVEPEDPRSYYSVAKRLAQEIPNSFYTDQYHNPSNPKAHYKMTGPEIWDQMGEELDYMVVASGTGGTITGIGKFLKEKDPKIKTLCVDPEGSIFYDYFKTGKAPKILTTYKVEGFGEDFIPDTIDFDVIDEMVQVSDRECFHTARQLTEKEGIFVGGSCGGAVAGAIKFASTIKEPKTFLIILPDSGSRYLSKLYDDDWMEENGFLEPVTKLGSVRDLLGKRYGKVITAMPQQEIKEIVSLMKKHSISQLPVVKDGKLIGLINEIDLLSAVLDGGHSQDQAIEAFVEQEFQKVQPGTGVEKLSKILKESRVAIVEEDGKVVGIVTKIDLVDYLSGRV